MDALRGERRGVVGAPVAEGEPLQDGRCRAIRLRKREPPSGPALAPPRPSGRSRPGGSERRFRPTRRERAPRRPPDGALGEPERDDTAHRVADDRRRSGIRRARGAPRERRHTNRAGRPAAGVPRPPCPGRSGTTTRRLSASSGARSVQFAAAPPSPWTSSTGSPSPRLEPAQAGSPRISAKCGRNPGKSVASGTPKTYPSDCAGRRSRAPLSSSAAQPVRILEPVRMSPAGFFVSRGEESPWPIT